MSRVESVRFDRAADYYDRTRNLADATMERVVSVLRTELESHLPCLEIGVGTGRIAVPLHEAGIEMIGLDLSRPMLAQLVAKGGGRAPFPLMVSDATHVPLASASAGSALVVHVLHLIPGWRTVLAELIRIVGPRGRVMVDMGGFGEGPWRAVTDYFAERAGVEVRGHGAQTPEEVDDAMRARGASVRVLDSITETRSSSFERGIRLLEDGLFSFTWDATPEARSAAAADTRAWARARFEDLDARFDYEMQIVYRVYDLPGEER
ncbi:MAG: class I SAM-dependent methyltransferase [Actinomycetota bacterium]